MGTQWPTLVHALVRRHSEKPEVFRDMIDCYFPTLPKIELHARGAVLRPGWDVWGPEAAAQRVAAERIDLTWCRPSSELAMKDDGQ
jgi:N6-adenosine-specific RNA methylase IME4